MARARAHRVKCIATRVTRQNMSEPNAWRARPIKRSRQQSVQKHTMLTTSVTLRVTPQASASTARRWQATNPEKGTVVARITPTMKTTLPSPSRPCLASEPSAMYYLLKGSWPSQCPSWMRTPTTTATTIDCNEHTRSPKRQPTLWPMWINRIDDREGVRHQRWDW